MLGRWGSLKKWKMRKTEHQILLIKGSASISQEKEIDLILAELGFTREIKIGKTTLSCPGSSLAGTFEGIDYFEVISEIRDKIKEGCKKKGIGAFEFLLVNITGTEMIYSMWHDGFY